MTLYVVEVETSKRALFYVRADSADEAREAGSELAAALGDGDWNDVEDDVNAKVVEEPRVRPTSDRATVTMPVWSGGPKGDFHDEEVPVSTVPWWFGR